ncbi:MAG: carbohydrate kinase, partial [Actinomycetota bacterium]|nr:carbohydrate kinase [Actinomycetota bacterium]
MVVVCGEALVDLTPARCGHDDGFVPHPGGSPYNVAVGLARLGVDTAFFGRLSHDPFGELLRGHLEANGVDATLVRRGPQPTALAFVHLSDGEPRYAFHFEGTADRSLRPEDLPSLDPSVRAVHFGSLSLALEPGASTLEAMMRRQAGAARLVSVDPNVRPALVGDRDDYLRRLDGWLGLADVVKVSVEDLAWLHPDEDPVDVGRQWRRHGPGLVVITRGVDGAVAWSERARAEVAAPPVDVVDTVGAGDAFMSGLLCWLAERGRVESEGPGGLDEAALGDALAFAARVAGTTCAR